MRHQFLLDENIIYHAIRGVNRLDQPDDTAAVLVHTIIKICHSLTIHSDLNKAYIRILHRLKEVRPKHLELTFFFTQVFKRIEKRTFEYGELPDLPPGCDDIPRKDRYLVQAAMISRPLFVTADEPLYDAVKNHPELMIDVLTPREALERARELPED